MKTFLISSLVIALSAAQANAWLRRKYSDAEIVSRAQLIAVGHIKPNSLVRVDKDSGRSHEHRGTLIVTEIFKGAAQQKEIPIIIHYGLDPWTGGRAKEDRAYSKDAVEIFDMGNSASSPFPVSGDIRDDQIWLLRIDYGYRFPDDEDALGIYDPEDIQSPAKKHDLQTALTKPQ